MDNRDEEENRPEAIKPGDDNDNLDWVDSEQRDTYGISSVPRDDLSEPDALDLERPLWADSENAEPEAMPTEGDAGEAPEKDWLVESGLAAAIRPEMSDPEPTSENTRDEDDEEDEPAWEDTETVSAYPDNNVEDGDLEEEDLDDDDEDFEDLDDDDEEFEDDLLEEEGDDTEDDPGEDSIGFSTPPIEQGDNTPSKRSVWPMLVGFVAVVLVAVGGWGLFEEKAALQARVNELERSQTLAQANTVDASMLSALETDNASLQLQLDSLYRDYELAMAEIAALQETTETAAVVTEASPEVALPETAEPNAAPGIADSDTQPGSSRATGSWFVNVGAFSVLQSAENLSARLNSAGFGAVVKETSTDAGKILYRVRVTGLSEKDDAQRVARELEASYGMGPVWIGQEPSTP
jgi:cell division septation protein DedD